MPCGTKENNLICERCLGVRQCTVDLPGFNQRIQKGITTPTLLSDSAEAINGIWKVGIRAYGSRFFHASSSDKVCCAWTDFPVVTSKIATLYINIYFTFIIYELWYFSSVKSSFSPVTFSNNRYNEGKTIRVKNVATNNPPITTVAKGRCTSAPAPLLIAIGKNPEKLQLPSSAMGRNRTWGAHDYNSRQILFFFFF